LYVPKAQGSQVEAAATAFANWPAAQDAQESEDWPTSALNFPATQLMHVSDVCVVPDLYLPATQLSHAAAEAAVALNFPAAQATTFDPDPV
jgi:hypothetical protein